MFLFLVWDDVTLRRQSLNPAAGSWILIDVFPGFSTIGHRRRRRTIERQEGHVTSRSERTRPSGILIFLSVCYTRVSACLCAGQCNTSLRDTAVGREEKSVAIKRHAISRPRDIGPCTRGETDILTYHAHIHPCLCSIFVCFAPQNNPHHSNIV